MRKLSTFNFKNILVAQPYDDESIAEQENELVDVTQDELMGTIIDEQDDELVDEIEELDEESYMPPVIDEEDIVPSEPEITPEIDEDAPDFGENTIAALQWAENNNQVIHIYYLTKNGYHVERKVEPHGLFVADSTGNLILVTYDRSVKGIRSFIVDQIEDYLFPGRTFKKKMRIVP